MLRRAAVFAIVGFAVIGSSGCSEPSAGESSAVIAAPDVMTAPRGATSAADEPPAGEATVEQILGFEDARLWLGAEAVWLSAVHSEGSFSLAVRPSGRAVYRSASFALAASTLRQLAIDVRIPASAGMPARAGTVRLAVASPSRGVQAVVGVADLTGRSTEVFTTIELDVPAALAERLNGGADDLRILVLLDVPRGGEPYLLDNLRLRTELILHYSFDAGRGVLADGVVPDRSGYDHTAVLRGAATITAAGRTGGALALDGNTSYLELPANLTEGVDELTVAAWINLDETRGWSRLFDFGGANGFVFLTPSTPDALIRYSAFAGFGFEGIATARSIPAGVWKHVAVTTTGRDYRLYVDGIEAASVLTIPVVPADIGANSGGNWIGRSRFPDPLLRGRVDDFRIYRRALNQKEIAALAQPRRDYASWRFDESDGSIVADSSELGLSGAIVGGASFERGLIGNAMTLSGAGQHVALPPGVVADCTDFTMAAWVKLRTNRPWNRVFDFGKPDFSSFMYLSPAGFGPSGQELRFGLISPLGIHDVGFPFQLPLGEWTHLAVTLRDDTATLFVNGRAAVRQSGVTSNPSDMGTTTGDSFGRSTFPDPSFDGSLDDIRMSCRAFDDREISHLAHVPAPAVLPSRVGVAGAVTDVHDPVMIERDGRFWLFSTGRGILARTSTDMTTWTFAGSVFAQNPAWVTEAIGAIDSLWAPDVSFFGGTHHLYYSASTFGSNRSCIGHATKDDLSSPSAWTDHGPVICSNVGTVDNFNAIDPNMTVSADGQHWLAFGSFWSGIKLIRLDATTGARAGDDIFDLASRPGDALEAPFVIYREPYYYLFLSFDFCCRGADSSYRTVVGRSRSITGPYVDRTGLDLLRGGGTPVVSGNARWRGPGHNAIVQRGSTWLNVYHSYDALNAGVPTLRISELVWQEGWPLSAEP
jgi:arabinan endo-1,5-alpha-L-arabinosidase